MSTGQQDMPGGPALPSREQALDELKFLASVEHALCVEFLLIYCALGHNLQPAGAAGQQMAAAAGEARSLAEIQMRHLRRVNQVLTGAGQPPQLDRAAHIGRTSVHEIALGPPIPTQREPLLDREVAIAAAVDERYSRLYSAVASPDPPFEDDLVEQLSFLAATCSEHSNEFADLRGQLEGLAPIQDLRVVRVQPTDEPQRDLLRLSDQYYGVVIANLQASFAHEELGSQLLAQATTTMEVLNEINGLMAAEGLLPAFTLPPTAPAGPTA